MLRRWEIKQEAEKLVVSAWFKLPCRVRHMFVFAEMGRLTVADPRLHTREVPTITVHELIEAARVAS